MKIRIKGNSLRYRLTKSDISGLVKDGYLQEHTNFLNAVLTYALKISDDAVLSSRYSNHTITLFMPEEMLNILANTDKIGFTATDGILQLLVEKDFTCLDNVDEDQSDNYPNPLSLQKN
jgi:hypothetical protein